MLPIAKPYIGKEEIAAVREVLLSGWLMQGFKVEEFESKMSAYVGSKFACAVSSGTAALHLALLTIGVKPGNIVITVSHSFIATANSVRLCGAEPLFVDIDLNTFNMSSERLRGLLEGDCELYKGKLYYKKLRKIIKKNSPLHYLFNGKEHKSNNEIGRIAAILPVHQMGIPCNLAAILSLAHKFKIPIVEDAACALGSEITIDKGKTWNKIGKPHGDIACFSFHPRKLITTGEGGMVTTNNPKYDKKVRMLRNHGMSLNRTKGKIKDKVVFEEYLITGYNYRMTDIQAAIGIAQLKKLPQILAERKRIANLYVNELKNINWVKLPSEPTYGKSNWQSYPIRLSEDAPVGCGYLMQRLLNLGISTRRGIMNAHQEPAYQVHASLRNSELARDSVILLPLFFGMTVNQIRKIAKAIKNA